MNISTNQKKNLSITKKSNTMVRKTNLEGQFDTYISLDQALKELNEHQAKMLILGSIVFTLFFIYTKIN